LRDYPACVVLLRMFPALLGTPFPHVPLYLFFCVRRILCSESKEHF
jgi:cytochrome c oxidase assembly protein Cox11